MLENPSGDFCYYNGNKTALSSAEGKALLEPVSDVIYYESIKVRDGVLMFFENHMLRLLQSVEAKEKFPIDTDILFDDAMKMLREAEPPVSDGNIRIVVTNKGKLIHFSKVVTPPEDSSSKGIAASLMHWERLDPQVKIFHSDYKSAVAAKFEENTPFGPAFEVLLTDGKGQITEGSRSNFFVLYHGVVYSPPETLILIGITRRYVLQSVRKAGLVYKEAMFSLEDLVRMRDESKSHPDSVALFITSSPFDILPVSSVGEEVFLSAQNQDLARISEIYQGIVTHYIKTHPADQVQPEYDFPTDC
jgi:branched-chain amino acid aminotransferase